MRKQTIVGKIEVGNDGAISAHLYMVVTDEGEEISRSRPHIAVVPAGADYVAAIDDINNDISTRPGLKWPAVQGDERERLERHCQIARGAGQK